MREYELAVVYDLAVQEAGGPDASVQQLTTLVESRGGKMLKVDHWGRRRMAYAINRAIDGDYIVSRVEMEPASVAPLEASLRIDERVYRHLVVRADELPLPVPPREPRQPQPVAAPVADMTGVAEEPATTAEAAALGEAEESPAPVEAAPGEDTAEGEAPASGTIAPPAETEASADEAVAAEEAIANADSQTEAMAEEASAPADAGEMETGPDNTPESTTTGFDSDAADVNSGIKVDDEDTSTGPHTEEHE